MRIIVRNLIADVRELTAEFGWVKLTIAAPLVLVVTVVETFVTPEPLGAHFIMGKRTGVLALWAGNVYSVAVAVGIA